MTRLSYALSGRVHASPVAGQPTGQTRAAPCRQAAPPPVGQDCNDCQAGTTPAAIQLTVPAGTFAVPGDRLCSNCNDFEGTFILPQELGLGPCFYQLFPLPGVLCGGQTVAWRVVITDVGTVEAQLILGGGGEITRFEVFVGANKDCMAALTNLTIPFASAAITAPCNASDPGTSAVSITPV